MLTWAIMWEAVRSGSTNGIWVLVACGCDVAIFYFIAQAAIALGGR